jgi:hypothetical protein
MFCYNCVVIAPRPVETSSFTEHAFPRLAAAVEELGEDEIGGLSDAALGEELIALRRHIDRLEYEFSRRLFRFDRARGYASEGATSAVSWLRVQCRLFGQAAAQRVEVARKLPELPQTERALRDGEIGFQHVAVIARSAEEVGVAAVRDVEATLVEAAQKLDPGRLRIVTRHLRHCLDPDGSLRSANQDHARRRLHLSQTLDGMFVLDGMLDAEGGALLRTAINALDTPASGDGRTASQRRADALIELATRQLQRGDLPAVAGQRPHLTLTAQTATVQRVPGAPAGELSWAGPVAAETVRRLACDAAVTRVTLDGKGQPLDVGRTARSIPAPMRRALIVRDRGCRFPGCDRPPEWTDGHHLRHWVDGGPTALSNLVLLCRPHHRMVHEEGWRLVGTAQGSVDAVPP